MNQKPSQQGQKRILAVDDEPDLTMICSLALEYYGFKVDTFNDPQEEISTGGDISSAPRSITKLPLIA